MISVVLADKNNITRQGVKHIINSYSDMRVIGEVENVKRAYQLLEEKTPDIIIMDFMDELKYDLVGEVYQFIRHVKNGVKIIVLTICNEKKKVIDALNAGASSYLLKSICEDQLINAIRIIYKDGYYLDPKIKNLLLKNDLLGDKTNILSSRELDVLSYTAAGYSNREIGEKMYLSTKTIDSYRARVMKKLEFNSRSELVRYALDNNLIRFE